MSNPLDLLALSMGKFLLFIYNNMSFLSYGLAIIIFTFFIRLLLLPLMVKQYRSMAKMQEIQPQMQELQKRYKNDKEKLNQEMVKLYQENNANPAGGCLPLLVQMPILFALYWVISQPLKFMMGKDPAIIQELINTVPSDSQVMGMPDLSIVNYYGNNPDLLSNVSGLLEKSDLLNMHFLGLNLGLMPSWQIEKILGSGQYAGLLLIPILAAVTTFISVKFSSMQNKPSADNAMAASMTNSMTTVMPFMTAFFAFSVPAGLGLYWIIGNVIQVCQQLYMNKYIIKKKEVTKG